MVVRAEQKELSDKETVSTYAQTNNIGEYVNHSRPPFLYITILLYHI
jgi:hypothetical protein